MNFTREPIIETIITPKSGYRLVVRNTKSEKTEEFSVDALEVVTFGKSYFYRSLEKPRAFLLPVSDYEVLEAKEVRVSLKKATIEKSIKISGRKTTKLRSSNDEEERPAAQQQKTTETSQKEESVPKEDIAKEKKPSPKKKKPRRRRAADSKETDERAMQEEMHKQQMEEEDNSDKLEAQVTRKDEKFKGKKNDYSAMKPLIPPPPGLISDMMPKKPVKEESKESDSIDEKLSSDPHLDSAISEKSSTPTDEIESNPIDAIMDNEINGVTDDGAEVSTPDTSEESIQELFSDDGNNFFL